MAIEKIHIDQFLGLAKQHILVDVRSPKEYSHAHIPGAFNLPLFSDEERAIVGTAYKQESREKAIKIGLDFFGPKMKTLVEQTEELVRSRESGVRSHLPITDNELQAPDSRVPTLDSRLVLLYCWRGGMRSAAIAWLMDLYGFKVYTLAGGYKRFRNYVLETFRIPFQFKILGGYTGSGKTEVLKELLRKGKKIVDLEDIAKHKGSAFGNIGMPAQPSQEMFENILAQDLRMKSEGKMFWETDTLPGCITGGDKDMNLTPIWLEDESQRIGLVNIPADLWKTMRRSPVYFLDIQFEQRLQHLVQEYGTVDREKLIDAIGRISQRLGGLEARNALSHLQQDDIQGCFRILLTYYDRWYLRGLHNRESINSLLTVVSCDTVNPLNAKKIIREPEYYETL